MEATMKLPKAIVKRQCNLLAWDGW